MRKGAPREKLIIGMPTYGRTFTLKDPGYYGIGAKAPRPGAAGKYTRENGFLSYYEVDKICVFFSNMQSRYKLQNVTQLGHRSLL